MHLLGLVHGHFDEDIDQRDSSPEDVAISKVNTGIAVVIPFHNIASVIENADAKWAVEDRTS